MSRLMRGVTQGSDNDPCPIDLYLETQARAEVRWRIVVLNVWASALILVD